MKITISSEVDIIKIKTSPVKKIASWIVKQLNLSVESLDIVFVSDEILKQLHYDFLNVKKNTDVITFNLSDNYNIEGEVYISIDRVKDQAQDYNVSLMNEVARLVIHGCLHLAGYDDLQSDQREIMKQKENYYVNMANDLFL